DGALSLNGQMNCYPKMLSEQFALAGGGEFRIPFMNDGGGNDASGNPRLVLAYTQPCGYSSPTLSPILDPLGATALHSVSATGPYNLVGVPGARSIDAIFPLYSSLNPFLGRFCQTPGTSTMLSEALRINPSFFTLWLGSNDVLLYALGGAVPPVTIYDPSITDSSSLRAALTLIVDTLTKNGAKGAIANVPDITSVPYFTTVPWNGVVISQGLADTLNVTYATAGLSHITWKAGANGFVIVDSSSPGAMRHATSSDLILLSTPGDSLRCGQWGVSPLKPLKDKYVLSVDEIAEINEYSTRYNATIANLASQYKLALVDMKAALKNLKSGMVYNGITLNTAYVSGGAFSLDGVHPNPRGYALLANEFIRAINLTYKSTIPQVDVTRYTGVLFP
ncbi:MAG TPA: SGNH/GDSL hydrolase family protein, partial [Chitinophagaceae bacterium]|nr:SGNH/GDSL hydrolase family protein [Chitinophagaceae bacterium]